MSEADLVEVPRALLERLLNRVDDLETELTQYRTENERDKATIRQDVHEAIEKAESGEATADVAENDESAPSDDSMTPMERLCSNSVSKASWPTSLPLSTARKPSLPTSANGPRRRRTG